MAKALRRRKKRGKQIGNWLWGEVNLGTKDATLARERAKLAAAGKWPADDVAAEAVAGSLAVDRPADDEATAPGTVIEDPPLVADEPARPEVARTDSGGVGAVDVTPDAVSAAAGEAGTSETASEGPTLTPEMMALIDPDQAAPFIVDGIFKVEGWIQGWVHRFGQSKLPAKERMRLEVVPVPRDNFGHQIMSSAGAVELRKLMQDLDPKPWQVIVVGFVVGTAWQVSNARQVPIGSPTSSG